MFKTIITFINKANNSINFVGSYVAMLSLRLMIAWEFWESGVEKFNGSNWFEGIKDQFPFPFNSISTDFSWFLSTWFELGGAIALVLGLGTRFTALSLIILDVVAWYAIHADNGYNVCSNGYKLPMMYLVMLLPLFFSGAGKLSLDYYIKKYFDNRL